MRCDYALRNALGGCSGLRAALQLQRSGMIAHASGDTIQYCLFRQQWPMKTATTLGQRQSCPIGLPVEKSCCKSASTYCGRQGISQLRSRHNDAVIIYDPQSQKLVLHNTPQGQLDLTECPTCHQPLRREGRARSREQSSPVPSQSTGFVHPAYFRLHQSLYGSRESSAPPSPQRRLVEPVRADESSPRSSGQAAYVDSPPASPSSTHGIAPSAFSPGYFQSCYVVEKELGRGGKGVVLLVTHLIG